MTKSDFSVELELQAEKNLNPKSTTRTDTYEYIRGLDKMNKAPISKYIWVTSTTFKHL